MVHANLKRGTVIRKNTLMLGPWPFTSILSYCEYLPHEAMVANGVVWNGSANG